MAIDQDRFGFIKVSHFRVEARSVDVDIESARDVTFRELLRRADIENNRAVAAVFFEMRRIDFLKSSGCASLCRTGFTLLTAGDPDGVSEIGGLAASPVMEKEHARLFADHVMMNSDDVDAVFQERSEHWLK